MVRNGPVVSRVRSAAPDESLKNGHPFLCCWIGKMSGRTGSISWSVPHITSSKVGKWLRDHGNQSRGAYRAGDLWGCVGAWFSGDWRDGQVGVPSGENYIARARTLVDCTPWPLRHFLGPASRAAHGSASQRRPSLDVAPSSVADRQAADGRLSAECGVAAAMV
jgi:hypothetical protein